MKQLPNILTLGNLFCGALAIIFVLNAPQYMATFNGQDFMVTTPEPVYWASFLVLLAGVFDFLDGLAARWLKIQSPFGKELDSLADVISFGVVPGMMLFRLLRSSYMQTEAAYDMSYIALAPALLVPCFAAYRLAKFNLDSRQAQHFIGVPTPAVALLVASFPLIVLFDPFNLAHILLNAWVLYGIIAVLCYLMICELPILSLKFKSLGFAENWPRFLLLVLAIAGGLLMGFAAVPFVFICYIGLSVVANQLKMFNK
jgi:CDP-diacylglycerol---serine O-phosphatidyltransferase